MTPSPRHGSRGRRDCRAAAPETPGCSRRTSTCRGGPPRARTRRSGRPPGPSSRGRSRLHLARAGVALRAGARLAEVDEAPVLVLVRTDRAPARPVGPDTPRRAHALMLPVGQGRPGLLVVLLRRHVVLLCWSARHCASEGRIPGAGYLVNTRRRIFWIVPKCRPARSQGEWNCARRVGYETARCCLALGWTGTETLIGGAGRAPMATIARQSGQETLDGRSVQVSPIAPQKDKPRPRWVRRRWRVTSPSRSARRRSCP